MYLDRILYPVTALGPGKRIAIWVSGCERHCNHCANPELWKQYPYHHNLDGFRGFNHYCVFFHIIFPFLRLSGFVTVCLTALPRLVGRVTLHLHILNLFRVRCKGLLQGVPLLSLVLTENKQFQFLCIRVCIPRRTH